MYRVYHKFCHVQTSGTCDPRSGGGCDNLCPKRKYNALSDSEAFHRLLDARKNSGAFTERYGRCREGHSGYSERFHKVLYRTHETAFFRRHQDLLEKRFGIGVWPIRMKIRRHKRVQSCLRETSVAYLTLPLSSHTQSQSVHRWNEKFSCKSWIRDIPTCGSAIPVFIATATEHQLRTFLRAMRLLRLKQLANPNAAEELDILSYANNLEEWRAAVDATLGEAQARPYLSLLRDTYVEPLSGLGLRTKYPARQNWVNIVEQYFRL